MSVISFKASINILPFKLCLLSLTNRVVQRDLKCCLSHSLHRNESANQLCSLVLIISALTFPSFHSYYSFSLHISSTCHHISFFVVLSSFLWIDYLVTINSSLTNRLIKVLIFISYRVTSLKACMWIHEHIAWSEKFKRHI